MGNSCRIVLSHQTARRDSRQQKTRQRSEGAKQPNTISLRGNSGLPTLRRVVRSQAAPNRRFARRSLLRLQIRVVKNAYEVSIKLLDVRWRALAHLHAAKTNDRPFD